MKTVIGLIILSCTLLNGCSAPKLVMLTESTIINTPAQNSVTSAALGDTLVIKEV
jgi:hypothetical protein